MDFQRSSVTLDIVVVGAGLGGLAAAISCALAGHKITVFEAATELREVGAGLQLTPNSSKILQKWNLSSRLWDSGAEPTAIIIHRYSDGKVLFEDNDFHYKMRERYGAPFMDVHRVDLQVAMYEKAKELGVLFQLGQRVENVDIDTATVYTAMTTKTADLVIAADGIWSKCREHFLGRRDPPRATGDLAYRLVLTLDQIPDEDLREMVRNPTVRIWIGPGAHAVGYSLRGGNMYNIVLLVPDDLPEGISRQPGSIDEMNALFENWDPLLKRYLGLVDSVDKWKLMHREELEQWVNDKGNFVCIGDCCHPMLPYLAQGVNSAIEDGSVLGLILGHLGSKTELFKALQIYEKLRKARGDSIVKETFAQRKSFHLPNGPEQEKRDELFLSRQGKGPVAPFPSRWSCPDTQPWLYGYDSRAEVEAALLTHPLS